MGQRVRRLSSPGGEERGEGEGQEERAGETAEGERREERRRQAQLLQIHRELQNVEVITTRSPPSSSRNARAALSRARQNNADGNCSLTLRR